MYNIQPISKRADGEFCSYCMNKATLQKTNKEFFGGIATERFFCDECAKKEGFIFPDFKLPKEN